MSNAANEGLLLRIVQLTFEAEHVASFQALFEETAPKVRRFSGCQHLELWQDVQNPSHFATYSWWESEDALNAYRDSPFFQGTWARIKPWFAAAPRAVSYQTVYKADS